MHGPDGVDYPNKTKYFEVDKYERLVYDHGGNDEQAPMFRVTVLFKEIKGKTKMDMTMSFASPEALEGARKVIKSASGNSTWDRLAEYLTKESTGKEQFVINRSFEAPLEKMFQMWTDPKHFEKWLPPSGFTMKFIHVDIKPGGGAFYCMTDGAKVKMYGRTEYLAIEKPNRIVYAQQFCDENEKVTRHPMSPTWPETMMTTVDFAAEGPDQTRVTVTWEPADNASAAELDTFIKARAGMTQGWTGSMDKLDEYLATPASKS